MYIGCLEPFLDVLAVQQCDQGHLCLLHVKNAALLGVYMRRVNDDPLETSDLECPYVALCQQWASKRKTVDFRRTIVQQINQPLGCADTDAHARLADGV